MESHTDLQPSARIEKPECVNTTAFAKEYARRAVKALPKKWREDWEEGDWDDFSWQQLLKAVKGAPGRYDKLVLSVLALHEFAKDVDPNFDVKRRGITLEPCLYLIRGFDTATWKQIKDAGTARYGTEFMRKLKNDTTQFDDRVFDKLAEYATCTHISVNQIINFLQEKEGLATGLECQSITKRAQHGLGHPAPGNSPTSSKHAPR